MARLWVAPCAAGGGAVYPWWRQALAAHLGRVVCDRLTAEWPLLWRCPVLRASVQHEGVTGTPDQHTVNDLFSFLSLPRRLFSAFILILR